MLRTGITDFGTAARATWIWVAVLLCLVVLIAYPLSWLVYISVRGETGLTLAHYTTVLTTPSFLNPIINSIKIATVASILGVLAIAPVAWAVVRTDIPLAKPIRLLIVASLALPPFLGAFAWQLLSGPNAGALNRLYVAVTGANAGPFNVYTIEGLIFVITLHHLPVMFLLITGALSTIDSEIEDAANILGAGTWRTAVTVVLPLLLPALLGGLLLVFLDTLADFGVPLIIGTPANVPVITTEIYHLLFQYPTRTEAAAAMSLLLLTPTVILLVAQRRALGRRGFATLTGKGGSRRVIRLGRWKYAVLGLALFEVACAVVLPYAILVRTALSKAWGADVSLANFTVSNFTYVLTENPATQLAMRNSLLLAPIAAAIAILLTAALAVASERRLIRDRGLISFLCTAPLVIPGIVLAIGVFFAYTKPPLFLYGTLWALLVAYVTKGIPFAFTNTQAAIKSVHAELEEAARLFGASTLRVFRDVSLPLMKAGLASGWMAVFVFSLRELSSAIFLYTAGTVVIAVVILQLQGDGLVEATAAMGVVLLVITMAVGALGYRLIGRDVLDLPR